MEFSLDFSSYTLWSLYGTIGFLLLAILGFIFKWGFRFRFVGATGFMGVLTVGLFALTLGLFSRVSVPNAVQFNLVYDTGANKAVIALPVDISRSQLDATLHQAAIDLFSYGRGAADNDNKFTIRARAQVHEDGFTRPLYLGQIRHSLTEMDDTNAQVTIFEDKFALLKSLTNE